MSILAPKVETIDQVATSVKQKIAETTGFELTNAVFPANEVPIWAGFQRAVYIDDISGRIQMLAIQQTGNLLFGLFTDLIEELLSNEKIKKGGIDAILESRHIPDSEESPPGKKYDCNKKQANYHNFLAHRVDPIAFLSRLYDYEDLMVNDGFCAVSFVSPRAFCELRLGVHKDIILFSKGHKVINWIAGFLEKSGLVELPTQARMLAEEPHVHVGHSDYNDKFMEFVECIGSDPID